METGLFDKNGIEIKVGDSYTVMDSFDNYNVYYKGGCVCGGLTFEKSIPLAWESKLDDEYEDEYVTEIVLNEDLSWLEIIKKD